MRARNKLPEEKIKIFEGLIEFNQAVGVGLGTNTQVKRSVWGKWGGVDTLGEYIDQHGESMLSGGEGKEWQCWVGVAGGLGGV